MVVDTQGIWTQHCLYQRGSQYSSRCYIKIGVQPGPEHASGLQYDGYHMEPQQATAVQLDDND